MDEALEQIQLTLHDAGCTEDEIQEAVRVYQTKGASSMLRQLRKCRCSRMEELHESQRKVDCLDYLIRQATKAFS